MIEKLATTLVIFHDDFYDNSRKDELIAADYILDFLERRGMLPPPTTRTAKVTSEKLEGFKWEPEDEEE